MEHMACSFRVDPLFNCTFVPVSSVLFYLCCISLSFLRRYLSLSCLSLSHLYLLLFHICIPISCLSLLSYPLILHCPGCYPALICWCVLLENCIYDTLCHQSSICVLMPFWESGKREAESQRIRKVFELISWFIRGKNEKLGLFSHLN